MSSKSSRKYFEFPLVGSDKKRVHQLINTEFDRFLRHTGNALTNKDREHLRKMALDQLASFMSELSDNKVRWSLDSNVITVHVQSKIDNLSRQMIEPLPIAERNKYRFTQRSNRWDCVYDSTNPKSLSYDKFKERVYTVMFNAVSTAAFYAVDSWVNNGGGK